MNEPVEFLRPRGEYVLLRLKRPGQTPTGIAVPDDSVEGHTWFILAVGPQVGDLEPGQRVLIMGAVGQDIAHVPNQKDIYITKQQNILLVVAEPSRDDVPPPRFTGES